jgi:hypothetical protein
MIFVKLIIWQLHCDMIYLTTLYREYLICLSFAYWLELIWLCFSFSEFVVTSTWNLLSLFFLDFEVNQVYAKSHPIEVCTIWCIVFVFFSVWVYSELFNSHDNSSYSYAFNHFIRLLVFMIANILNLTYMGHVQNMIAAWIPSCYFHLSSLKSKLPVFG